MIVVTGGAGFIGSCIAAELNRRGQLDLVLVDSLGSSEKWKNLRGLDYLEYLDKHKLFGFLKRHTDIKAVVHMGACSSTTELDANYLMNNNTRYTARLAKWCVDNQVRFVYASSAATYGDGGLGFKDDEDQLDQLKPLNMYGYSKHAFDLIAKRRGWLPHMAGLKFFNVFGPNEYHKQNMVSVVYQAFHQIKHHGEVRLFKSYRSDYADGEQRRDFVYVKDVVKQTMQLLESKVGGIYNAGSGTAHSFNQLVTAVFAAMDQPVKINYVDMPDSLRDRYQYFTEADMRKAREAGLASQPYELNDSVRDYVVNYLMPDEKHEAGRHEPF